MRYIDSALFFRYLSVLNNGEMNFFLGSGASSQAGIPTGGTMVWEFKRSIYCTENKVSTELLKDLYSEGTRSLLQNYFDKQGNHPALWSPGEYSHYFEECFNSSISREHYIQQKVKDIRPSIGHLCLASLFISKKISNIFTTNFDELIESGIKTICPNISFNVYSTANKSVAPKNSFSSIIKLHGDYRYDHIKNTSSELQNLEESMKNVFYESLKNTGLVVVGYSGSDDSIMSILENSLKDSELLKYGLIWALPTGVKPSQRVESLLDYACQINENSGIVYIQDFDSFMHDIYINTSEKNEIIDNGWADYSNKKLPIVFNRKRNNTFTKLNTFESVIIPECYVFETDINRWSDLKELVKTSQIIAALYSQKIYCFGNVKEIETVFQSHIKSPINKERISNKLLYKYDSIYVGMLYSLLKQAFVSLFGLNEYAHNKYYDAKTLTKNEKHHCNQYDAFETAISIYNSKAYLHIIPTVYITNFSGHQMEKLLNQRTVNSIVSSIYNKTYNDKL